MKCSILVAVITGGINTASFALGPSSTVLESAVLPYDFNAPGATIAPFQYVACRFRLSQPTLIDHIGGGIGGLNTSVAENTVFGAIASLTSPSGFPIGSPSVFVPVAATTFQATYWANGELGEQLVPLSAQLPIGDYALIFGSGRFGAQGRAVALRGYTDTAQASFFLGEFEIITNPQWNNNAGLHGMRFLITGTVVPEPSATIFILAIPVLISRRRSRN